MQLRPFEAFLSCLKKYNDFSGRTSRFEYWNFFLASFILISILEILFKELHMVFRLLLILPILASQVRRLHDIGKSGKILFGYPIVYFIQKFVYNSYSISEKEETIADIITYGYLLIVLIFLVTKGDPQKNNYGEPPVFPAQNND